jgi:hypothetical protein
MVLSSCAKNKPETNKTNQKTTHDSLSYSLSIEKFNYADSSYEMYFICNYQKDSNDYVKALIAATADPTQINTANVYGMKPKRIILTCIDGSQWEISEKDCDGASNWLKSNDTPEGYRFLSNKYKPFKAQIRKLITLKMEDLSMKAVEKPLSELTYSDIESAPMNIRFKFYVQVPVDITKEELRVSMIDYAKQKESTNPDIDEIVIFAYYQNFEVANSGITAGRLEWAPFGTLGNMTQLIASSNDRASYSYTIDIKEVVGKIDMEDIPTQEEINILDYHDSLMLKISDEKDRIIQVCKKYGITEGDFDHIFQKYCYYMTGSKTQ